MLLLGAVVLLLEKHEKRKRVIQVLLFGGPGCTACEEVKVKLTALGIDHEYADPINDAGALKELSWLDGSEDDLPYVAVVEDERLLAKWGFAAQQSNPDWLHDLAGIVRSTKDNENSIIHSTKEEV